MRSLSASASGQQSRARRCPIVVDPETLMEAIKKKQVRVVDVRKKEEYDMDHILGAASIPLADVLNADSLE